MIELCPFCGGTLKADGKGYLCSNCSTKIDSAEELERFKPKKKTSQTVINQTVVEKQVDHGVDVFDTNIKGVLEITWSDGQYKHSGSGSLVTKDGFAITNTHVVTSEDGRSCEKVNVKICGKKVSADVIRLGDSKHGDGDGVDLALIKLSNVPNDATIMRFETFDNVKNGERVFVIGNSLGHGTCITSGIVSDKVRNVNGKLLMMTDCAINGGNSGGPIFNEKGLVIGTVVSGITAAEGMNFAIPSNTVMEFIQSILDIRQMQMIPEKANPYDDPTHFSGEYRGPGTPLPSTIPKIPGGRFWGIGQKAPKENIPGGRFEGLRKKEKAIAPCPRCDSDNTFVENGIFICLDCDFEGG